MTKENLVDIYLRDLETVKQPGLHLAKFMWEALDKSPNTDDIKMISRLVRLYGRINVFAGLLELVESNNLDDDRYYGLLVYIIKHKVISGASSSSQDLTEYVKRIKKDIHKKRRVADRSNPFEEEECE